MIDSIFILSHDEQHAPPSEKVLQISMVKDVVFFGIAEVTETYDAADCNFTGQIGVKVKDVYDALSALIINDPNHMSSK